MIAHVDDFCLCVYVLVDDMYKELEGHLRRPGPKPTCSDSELIAISLIGECFGWDVETELLNHMQAHRDKFPIIPEQSRFNRRRRNLMGVINEMRRMILSRMELYWDEHCVVDSLPIPVVQFHLAPQARIKWSDWGADYGPVPSVLVTRTEGRHRGSRMHWDPRQDSGPGPGLSLTCRPAYQRDALELHRQRRARPSCVPGRL